MLATMAGARVYAVEHTDQALQAHHSRPVELFNSGTQDVAQIILDQTGGRG